MTTRILYIIPALLSILMLDACSEKGCTDKNAINYNVAADEDDGTCILCRQKTDVISYASVILKDDYYQSNFYNQDVAWFKLEQAATFFDHVECGKTTCSINLKIVNLTDKNMILNYQIYDSGPNTFAHSGNITIPPNSTYDEGTISTTANANTLISNQIINIYTNSYISYY